MDLLRTLTGTCPPPTTSTSIDHNEELLADVDEPPDEPQHESRWSPPKFVPTYSKAVPVGCPRRESLLTRQIHSETEHSDEDAHIQPLKMQPTWSTQSTASTAELTSDDGKSVTSPAVSPPLPATYLQNALPVVEKPLGKSIRIVDHIESPAPDGHKDVKPEQSIEAGLGRKRCITFACGGKPKTAASVVPTATESETSAAPPPSNRKCTIKFACPNQQSPAAKPGTPAKRPVSPSPPGRSTAGPVSAKAHRGSDSTVTHASPRNVRKSAVVVTGASNATATATAKLIDSMATPKSPADLSDDSGGEALRFHEFAVSDDEPEEWVKEITCHRSRLTISDTLKKENVIRKACEEVEEEVIEEEEEEGDDEDADAATAFGDDRDDNENPDDEDESDDSDDGFHSDDEEGFADSDSENGEGSDNEWWRPGGRSTAATSVEHLDRLALQPKPEDGLASSLGSVSSAHMSPRSSRQCFHQKSARKARRTHSVAIHRSKTPDLPDSTDFICGTLDEDRPLEQAYIKSLKDREAAKHKVRPQDIDPTFPTSDPEMDEEDDEDLEDPEESENEKLLHGELEEINGEPALKGRVSPRLRGRSNRSPPLPARLHSPPPTKRRNHHHSPPPLIKRATARSPPPRKLFGQSPRRIRSPAPGNTTSSPPNTRRTSPAGRGVMVPATPFGLGGRPQLTHTASLPRGTGFLLSEMCGRRDEGEGSDTVCTPNTDVPKRGAIDIVKGLERKRQRRKEKLYQKMCAKAAAKGEKAYKVKPGKGAERMREVGLELQRYRGKGEHIISV